MKKIFIFLSLLLVAFVSSRALLKPEFFRVHDFIHVARLAEMDRALADGHFPVRWSENFSYGYGMPLFSFYAPLPSYIGMIFVWLGFSYVQSVRLLFFLVSLVTLIGSYKLGKTLWNSRSAGVITAALVTLAPYRAVNLYIRGALSEAWGIAFIPFVLLGIVLMMRQDDNGKYYLLLSIAGLLLSHNLVSLMFLPLSVLFVIYFAKSLFFTELLQSKDQHRSALAKKHVINVVKVGAIYLWGVALAAFYIIPAFFEKELTKVEQAVTGGYFDYHLHFLYIRQFFSTSWGYGGSEWGPGDSISFSLGTTQLVFLLMAGLVTLLFLLKEFVCKKEKNRSLFSFLVKNKVSNKKLNLTFAALTVISTSFLLAVALFMSLTKSQFIWDAIAQLEFIQFPWRWLSVAIVFVGVITSSVMVFVPKRTRYSLVIFAVLFSSITGWNQFTPEDFLENSDDFYYSDEERIQTQMSDILFDYQPVQMAQPLTPPTELVQAVEGAEFESSIVVDRVHQKAIAVHVTNPGALEVAISAFPGWHAYVNGEKVEWHQTELGSMMVDVDQDTQIVSFDYQGTQLQKISNAISLIALLALVIPWITTHGIKKEFQYHPHARSFRFWAYTAILNVLSFGVL